MTKTTELKKKADARSSLSAPTTWFRQFRIGPPSGASLDEISKSLVVGTVSVGGQEYSIYRFSISSETPVERYDWERGTPYLEVLSHDERDIDLARFRDGAAMRDGHWGDQVGCIDDARVNPQDRKLQVDCRFLKDGDGPKFENGLRALILKNVSIRYITMPDPVVARDPATGMEVRTFKWAAIHGCFTPDGADPEVGPGRHLDLGDTVLGDRELPSSTAADRSTAAPQSTTREEEKTKMTDEERKALEDQARERERKAAADAVAAARANDREIRSLAREHGLTDDEAEDMVTRGLDRKAAAVEILDRKKPTPRVAPTTDPVAALSKGERHDLRKRYSLARALDCAVQFAATGKGDGIEWEHHQRLLKEGGQRAQSGGNSFCIPWRFYSDDERMDLIEQRSQLIRERAFAARAMSTGGLGLGMELVAPLPPLDILDAFRSAPILDTMGVNFLYGLRGELPMPRFLTDMQFYCADENPPAETPESEPTTAIASLKPKTVRGKMVVANQLFQLTTYDLQSVLIGMAGRAAAVKSMALALNGTGTQHQPQGLANVKGVTPVPVADSSGHHPVYGDFVDMSTAPALIDATGERKGYVTTPGMQGYLSKRLEFSAAGSTKIWTGDDINGRLNGFPAAASTICRSNVGTGTNEHQAFYGPWKGLNVAQFGDGLDIIVDRVTRAGYQQTVIWIYWLMDAGTATPEAFSQLTGAILLAG